MRPPDIEQLIKDLRTEKPYGKVDVQSHSQMVVCSQDDQKRRVFHRHVFNEEECKLLLANPGTVERMFEALDYPDDAFIELCDLEVSSDVLEILEKYAETVDEV